MCPRHGPEGVVLLATVSGIQSDTHGVLLPGIVEVFVQINRPFCSADRVYNVI